MEKKKSKINEKVVVKFGTDGWRGIIADDFTVEKVKIVTQGICQYLKGKAQSKNSYPLVVIGYDTWFLSDRFAKTTANVFGANSIKVYISTGFIPTPTLSTAVVKKNADLGIMITASHNPYYYNGYKIKGHYGGSATPDITSEIENEVNRCIKDNASGKSYNKNLGPGENIKEVDFTIDYKKHILGLIDTDAIKNFDFKLLVEPMYGAAQNLYKSILENISPGKVVEIHSVLNPAFGGINPEPIGDNLNDAISALKKEGCKLGICLDGDGDRIGALGEDGNL